MDPNHDQKTIINYASVPTVEPETTKEVPGYYPPRISRTQSMRSIQSVLSGMNKSIYERTKSWCNWKTFVGLLLIICLGPPNVVLAIQFWRSPGLTMKMWADTDVYTRTLGNIHQKIQDGFMVLAVYVNKRNGTRKDWKTIRLGKPLWNYLPETTKTGVRALEDIYPERQRRSAIFGEEPLIMQANNVVDMTKWITDRKMLFVSQSKFDEMFSHCTEVEPDLETDDSNISKFDLFQAERENRTGSVLCLKRGAQSMAFIRYNGTDFKVIATCGVSSGCKPRPRTQEQWVRIISNTEVDWKYVFWAACPPKVQPARDCPGEEHMDFILDKLALKPFSSKAQCDNPFLRIVVNGSDVNCPQAVEKPMVTEMTLTAEVLIGTSGENPDSEKPGSELQNDEPIEAQTVVLMASEEIRLNEPSRFTRETGEEDQSSEESDTTTKVENAGSTKPANTTTVATTTQSVKLSGNSTVKAETTKTAGHISKIATILIAVAIVTGLWLLLPIRFYTIKMGKPVSLVFSPLHFINDITQMTGQLTVMSMTTAEPMYTWKEIKDYFFKNWFYYPISRVQYITALLRAKSVLMLPMSPTPLTYTEKVLIECRNLDGGISMNEPIENELQLLKPREVRSDPRAQLIFKKTRRALCEPTRAWAVFCGYLWTGIVFYSLFFLFALLVTWTSPTDVGLYFRDTHEAKIHLFSIFYSETNIATVNAARIRLGIEV